MDAAWAGGPSGRCGRYQNFVASFRNSCCIPDEKGAIRTLITSHTRLMVINQLMIRPFPQIMRAPVTIRNGITAVATRA